MTTLTLENTRKYHSLFTISQNPPTDRLHMVAALRDEFISDSTVFERTIGKTPLLFNKYGTLNLGYHIGGDKPYSNGGKQFSFLRYTNILEVRYLFNNTRENASILLTPEINFRDHHDCLDGDLSDYTVKVECLAVATTKNEKADENKSISDSDASRTIVKVSSAKYDYSLAIVFSGEFYEDLRLGSTHTYPIEEERGYPFQERNVEIGKIKLSLSKGVNDFRLYFLAYKDVQELGKLLSEIEKPVFEREIERFKKLALPVDGNIVYSDSVKILSKNPLSHEESEGDFALDPTIYNLLLGSADDFLVKRSSTNAFSVIAGYPWFTDWGRDAMISLPGLTLVNRRYDEFKSVIESFLSYLDMGVIPNTFPDNDESPMYNTIDATLWVFEALYKYYEQSLDKEFIEKIYDKLRNIIVNHIKGTKNDIGMDAGDYLLFGGDITTQLSWMDVKYKNLVMTPRYGKLVEINALWYNALKIYDKFSALCGRRDYSSFAEEVKKSFKNRFIAPDGRLFDSVDGHIDGQKVLRPNMIFAASLSYPVLNTEEMKAVVDFVGNTFDTPYGLRSLDPSDADYRPIYIGDLLERDSAYHRGIAWGFLKGAYLTAHFRVYKDKEFIKSQLQEMAKHIIDDGVIGSYSEIFDSLEPFTQRGASAQAWSVAEMLRIISLIDENIFKPQTNT